MWKSMYENENLTIKRGGHALQTCKYDFAPLHFELFSWNE